MLFVAVLLTSIFCGLDPAHLIRPLPVTPSAPPDVSAFVYASTNTAVYGVVKGGEGDETLVAVKWAAAGTVVSNGTALESIEACPESQGSLLIRRLANSTVDTVIRYPGLCVHHVYMNSTQVVVVGSGLVGDAWAVPDAVSTSATVIQRSHAGYTLIAIVYDRDTLVYRASSLILSGSAPTPEPTSAPTAVEPLAAPDPPTEVELMVGRGYMNDVGLGVALSGTCLGLWTVTPQLVGHTTSVEDRTFSCGAPGTITALVVVWFDLHPNAVWRASTLNADPDLPALTVNVHSDGTEIAVFGSHTADESGTFDVPLFVTFADAGTLPAPASPPAVQDISWLFGDGITTAAYLARWDAATFDYISFAPFETISSNMYVKYRTGYVDFFTDVSMFGTFSVFDFGANVTLLGVFNDPSAETVSPIMCSWGSASGSMHSCVLLSGTADVYSAYYPGPSVVHVVTAGSSGNVSVSDWRHPEDGPDFIYPSIGASFTGIQSSDHTSIGVVLNSNSETVCVATPVLVPDGITRGTYHHDGVGAGWFADVGGVKTVECTI